MYLGSILATFSCYSALRSVDNYLRQAGNFSIRLLAGLGIIYTTQFHKIQWQR